MAIPSREKVNQEVIEVNQRVSDSMGNSVVVEQDTRYWEDLGYTKTLVRELAVPHTKISQSHGGLRISKSESGEMKTVSDACELTYEKIKAGHNVNKKSVPKKKAALKRK